SNNDVPMLFVELIALAIAAQTPPSRQATLVLGLLCGFAVAIKTTALAGVLLILVVWMTRQNALRARLEARALFTATASPPRALRGARDVHGGRCSARGVLAVGRALAFRIALSPIDERPSPVGQRPARLCANDFHVLGSLRAMDGGEPSPIHQRAPRGQCIA